ncbi:MAG: S8 family serine peptidase [Deltaproteobacteria bacterium]|nr:S8 family serine peptidase [Deltaproteobacteria bacterium]
MKKGVISVVLVGIVFCMLLGSAIAKDRGTQDSQYYIVHVRSARAALQISKDLHIELENLFPPLLYKVKIAKTSHLKIIQKLEQHPLVERIIQDVPIDIQPIEEAPLATVPETTDEDKETYEVLALSLDKPNLTWWQNNEGQLMYNFIEINRKSGKHKVLDSLSSISGVDIRLREAHALGKGTPEVTVAVIDSGVDITHPALQNNIYKNAGEIENNGVDDDKNGLVDDIHGWNFALNSMDLIDRSNHGTAIAGIIAGNGQDFQGVCPQCVILPISTDGNHEKQSSISHFFDALQYARTQKVRIINLSLVIKTSEFEDVKKTLEGVPEDALNHLKEREKLDQKLFDIVFQVIKNENIIVVAGAGNEGDRGNPIIYPASSPYVISVGGMTPLRSMIQFSSWGEWLDILAPSIAIWAPQPLASEKNTFGNHFNYFTGTSFAAPMVAGAAALLMSQNPGITADQVQKTLTAETNTEEIETFGRGRFRSLNVFKSLKNPILN